MTTTATPPPPAADDQYGLAFTQERAGTYCARFADYSPEPAINAQQARRYLAEIKRAAAAHPGQKINIINDTRLIKDRVKSLSGEARRLYLTAYRHPQIGKVAMVGFNPWLKNFIMILAPLASRTSQTAFFDTKEEALAWIKDNPPTAGDKHE